MRDGVRLAVTYFRPRPTKPDETFPVLFEMIPYRKEDSFYFRDYGIYSYLVRFGFILAKVDVRGTGSSEGELPPREYSDIEIADAVEIIDQLSHAHGSNGKVGMWGKSWGGFNSLQVAMRRPPALAAVMALHASDDLYHDDVHFIDGVLHVDPYALEIDHENGLPRPPDYPLDSAYFHDRFDTRPWIFTYLEHAVEDDWWRAGSLRFHPDAARVPMYLIGGMLDGYRDTPIRLLAAHAARAKGQAGAPVKVDMGPWEHAYPDDGAPGPTYEWRERAARWFAYWLKGESTGIMDEPPLLVFERAGQLPDANQTMTAGEWRQEDWPIRGSRWTAVGAGRDHRLVDPFPAVPREVAYDTARDALRYKAGYGVEAGDWWGDPTGDMRADDAGSLVYDGDPLTHAMRIIGCPRAELGIDASVPLANWSVRLEDVAPTGEVALVTGAALNGTQIASPLAPVRLVPGRHYAATIDLHFTTWTFQPGHRIRLAVTNTQFPMLWPTPYPMITELSLGSAHTFLRLPVVPTAKHRVPTLPPSVPRSVPPDGRELDNAPPTTRRVTRDLLTGSTTVELHTGLAYEIAGRRYRVDEAETYETSSVDPSRSQYSGDESHRIDMAGGRALLLRTLMEIRSDSSWFHVTVTRRLSENNSVVRERTWTDSVARVFH